MAVTRAAGSEESRFRTQACSTLDVEIQLCIGDQHRGAGSIPVIVAGLASEIRAQCYPDVRVILAPPPTNLEVPDDRGNGGPAPRQLLSPTHDEDIHLEHHKC